MTKENHQSRAEIVKIFGASINDKCILRTMFTFFTQQSFPDTFAIILIPLVLTSQKAQLAPVEGA